MTTSTIECLYHVALECTAGTSDKLYVIQVIKDGSTYRAYGYNGRRGRTLIQNLIYEGASLSAAIAAAEKKEKTQRKTYEDHVYAAGTAVVGMPAFAPTGVGAPGSKSSGSPSSAPRPVTGPRAQLAEPDSFDNVQKYIDDPNFVLQKKYDGERLITEVTRDESQGFNRDGIAKPLTTGVVKDLTTLTASHHFRETLASTLDGEVMGDTYVVFDMLKLRDADIRNQPFDVRYSELELLLETVPLMLAKTAWTAEDKQTMVNQALAENWEGLIAREINAPYVSSRTKNVIKLKLWATATCRVSSVSATRRSIQVDILNEEGFEEPVGNVSVPVNQDVPDLDSLVEIRYLYVLGPKGSLYQPVLLRTRDDVHEADTRASLRVAPPERRKAIDADESVAAPASPAIDFNDDI